MQFSFENQGTSTYFVYKVGKDEEIDSMSLGMLTNNKIPGLASAIFTQMDEDKYIKYNVSSKVAAKEIFTGNVNRKRLLGVLSGIVNAMISSEEYMIDMNTLMLDLNYIFSDVSTCETVIICVPVMELKDKQTDIGAFFKNIVFSTRFDQTENCDYVAKLINYLNGTPSFSLYEFKAILDELNNQNVASLVQPMRPSQPSQPPVQLQPMGQPAQPIRQPQPIGQPGQQVRQPQPIGQPVQPIRQPQPMVQPGPQVRQPQPMVQPIIQPQPMDQPIIQPQPMAQQVRQPQPMQQPQAYMIPNEQAQQPKEKGKKTESGEKKMSMLYLMRHYSKENAQLYKEQHAKDAQSDMQMPNQPMMPGQMPNQVGQMPQQPVVPQPQDKNSKKANKKENKKAKKNEQPNNQMSPGFAIPGQQVSGIQPMQAQQVCAPQMQTPPSVPPMQTPQPMQMQQPVQTPPMQQVNSLQGMQPMASQPGMMQMQQMAPAGGMANFGETTVLGGAKIGETTVLNGAVDGATVQAKPYLIRTKYNEKILIDKTVFKLGKEKSYVDYFISDNTAVSRSHANILFKDNQYYVVDTNSTNHTFVNGEMIQSNAEKQIKSGDRIKLANEEFEFRIL